VRIRRVIIAALLTLGAGFSGGAAEHVYAGGTPSFQFRIPNSVAVYDRNDGGGAFTVAVTITELNTVTAATYGFSMGLAHDASLFTPTFVAPVGPLPAIGGGVGPEFFGITIYPGGVTVDVAYELGGLVTLAFDAELPVLSVHYSTQPVVFQGNPGPVLSVIQFDDTFGMPPVENRVVVSSTGDSEPPITVGGTITLVPSGPFIRGDCNVDGHYDLGDAVTIVGLLFGGVSGGAQCERACDGNDDGAVDVGDAVYLLLDLFSGGTIPAAPFPACGDDLTPDSLLCPTFPPC
jgi:hypothetical protein